MPTTAEAILDELASAFPAKRPDPFAPLVNSTLGDEPVLVTQAFADKADWTRLDPDWLEQQVDALHFFSNAAICFYIPAFIAADLKGRLANTDPVFALTHGFAHGVGAARIHPRKPRTWGDYARDRWAALTPQQARVIAHYLEWKIDQNGPGIDSAAEALQDYWYKRAAGS
jgi:hypothetical protein